MQVHAGKLPTYATAGDFYIYKNAVYVGAENGALVSISELLKVSPHSISVGPQGEIGAQGAPGATGPKGEKGEKGDRGRDGATGPKGDRGSDGRDGDRGKPGEVGPQGAPGASIQGPQGVQGAQGAKGERGDVQYVGAEDLARLAAILRMERLYMRGKLAELFSEASALHGSDKVFALYFLSRIFSAANLKED
jgi:hypothetical protein